jgi:putative adhesin
MLIYQPMSNTNPITINGNSGSQLTGSILAPAADISLSGTGDSIAVNSQVIGLTVQFSGNATADISYNDSQNYDATVPPSIELVK